MIEQFADIGTPAGTMRTFVVHPERNGPFPAVILYMDFWGVREELHDIARWVATVGFCCVVPDFYYRQGSIHNAIRDPQGRMVSLTRLDKETQAKVLAPLRRFSDDQAMDDTAALLQFLASHKAVRTSAKGCFGFCLGGRLALRAAARFPTDIKAAASLHGSALAAQGENAPHLLAKKIQGELYCGFAEHDPHTPATTAQQIAEQMRSSAAQYSYCVHAGAEHGYALPDRDIYNKPAALRDWESILAMYQRQIPPYRS